MSQGDDDGESYCASMIEEFDEDGDGKITFEEFYNNMYKLLNQVSERRESEVGSIFQSSNVPEIIANSLVEDM